MNKMTIKGEFSVDGVKRGPIIEIEVEEHRGVIFMPDDIIAQLNKAWGGFDWTGCEFLVTKVFNKDGSTSWQDCYNYGDMTHFWQWDKKTGNHRSQGIMGQETA